MSANLSGLQLKLFLVTQGSALTRATLGWMLRTPSAFPSLSQPIVDYSRSLLSKGERIRSKAVTSHRTPKLVSIQDVLCVLCEDLRVSLRLNLGANRRGKTEDCAEGRSEDRTSDKTPLQTSPGPRSKRARLAGRRPHRLRRRARPTLPSSDRCCARTSLRRYN